MDRRPFYGLFTRTSWETGIRKVEPVWILLQQTMMGWQWHQLDHMQIICTSLQTDNHASTSSLNVLKVGCSSCRPTNSVKVAQQNMNFTFTVLKKTLILNCFWLKWEPCISKPTPSQEVSMLPAWHHAAYHRQSDTFWSAISLRHNELRHTSAVYQIHRTCLLVFRSSGMELSTRWFTNCFRHHRF